MEYFGMKSAVIPAIASVLLASVSPSSAQQTAPCKSGNWQFYVLANQTVSMVPVLLPGDANVTVGLSPVQFDNINPPGRAEQNQGVTAEFRRADGTTTIYTIAPPGDSQKQPNTVSGVASIVTLTASNVAADTPADLSGCVGTQ